MAAFLSASEALPDLRTLPYKLFTARRFCVAARKPVVTPLTTSSEGSRRSAAKAPAKIAVRAPPSIPKISVASSNSPKNPRFSATLSKIGLSAKPFSARRRSRASGS